MLIQNRPSWTIPHSETTPKAVFLNRRRFLQGAAGAGAALALAGLPASARANATPGAKLENVQKTDWNPGEEPTKYSSATGYNNFYEFGFDKGDPQKNADSLKPRPWTVTVGGHVENPGAHAFDDLVKPHQLEERIYRFRCVEAWSMVVPWIGIPLKDMVERFKPTAKARYVAFKTLLDPEQMPEQNTSLLDWPYVEGLRLDEAMNPLTLMVVGMYGEVLPNQNGAPLRLMVPWKYGFKSIKSIVAIDFVEDEPPTTWNQIAPREYGFYANVNPKVSHPRWSQATERRLGDFLRRDTLMFNGYGEQVASLYQGMDLAKAY